MPAALPRLNPPATAGNPRSVQDDGLADAGDFRIPLQLVP